MLSPSNLEIIDTTLREGNQFKYGSFNLQQKKALLLLLDNFGVQYAELMNPLASKIINEEIVELLQYRNEHNLKIKLLLHIRLNEPDIKAALLHKNIDGLSMAIGTSKILAENSHHLNIAEIAQKAIVLLKDIRKETPHLELRLSGEDSFRSQPENLRQLITTVEPYVDRIGIPDTIGMASPRDIAKLINYIRSFSQIPLECHFHNDSDSAVANAYEAWLCGIKYINTSVLGIGERNGITNFSGMIARLYQHPEVLQKFNLKFLPAIDKHIADAIGKEIPFNNPITGEVAFNHKAGIHINAMIKNKQSYQAIDPADFGLESRIEYINPLMGWHSLQHYLKIHHQLEITPGEAKVMVAKIKDEGWSVQRLLEDFK